MLSASSIMAPVAALVRVLSGGPGARINSEVVAALEMAQSALHGHYVTASGDKTGRVIMPQVMDFHIL